MPNYIKKITYLCYFASILSCTQAQPTKPVSSSPSPNSPSSSPQSQQPRFQLHPSRICYGEKLILQGTGYLADEKRQLILQHPITRERDAEENPEQYLLLDSLTANEQGHITGQLVLQEKYPGRQHTEVRLEPGDYVAILKKENGSWDDSINLKICPPGSLPNIPSPPPGSGMGWPEDLEPGQPYLQALPASVCQGEPIRLRAFQFTPGDWVGLSMQTQDQVFSLSEQLQIDGATQAHFFLESEHYPPGEYTVTLLSHALEMQAEARITIRDACDTYPTAAPMQPVFNLDPAASCPGEEISLKLVSSGFGRSQLPISLFPAPQSQPVDVETPGGNKYPPPQDSSTALLGELSVSPLGTGELRFTLQNSYITRGGQSVQINNGQRYLLYWQERPDAFTYITDIMPHNCTTEP